VTGRPRATDSPRPDPTPSGDGVRLSTEVAREILSAVNGLSFGSVEVVVHDSRVVQIERRQRVRLDGGPAPRTSKHDRRGRSVPDADEADRASDFTGS
jgi:hypothetical protein